MKLTATCASVICQFNKTHVLRKDSTNLCKSRYCRFVHTGNVMVKGRGRIIPYSSREFNRDHICMTLKNAYVADCIKCGPSSSGLLSGDRGTGTLGIWKSSPSLESPAPIWGKAGNVPRWVLIVTVVLRPKIGR